MFRSKETKEAIEHVKSHLKMWFNELFFKDDIIVTDVSEVSLSHNDPNYMEMIITTRDADDKEQKWVLKPYKKS